MTNSDKTEITFPVARGIFGVGRLATELNKLQSDGLIGPWHVGHWIDYTHAAIRIQFGTVADGEVALQARAN